MSENNRVKQYKAIERAAIQRNRRGDELPAETVDAVADLYGSEPAVIEMFSAKDKAEAAAKIKERLSVAKSR